MAGSVLHHHSIVLCHHTHNIDKLQLAHAQNSKLEKANRYMAIPAVPCPTALDLWLGLLS